MNSRLLVKSIIYFLIALLVLTIFWLLFKNYSQNNPSASVYSAVAKEPEVPQSFKPTRDWSLAEPEINANSAICVEVSETNNDKVLFNKGEAKKLPIASLTKLMTALVAIKNNDLNSLAVVSENAIAEEGEQGVLKAGEVFSVNSLLHLALIESSNDAAYALAEMNGVDNFIDLMNREAKALGLVSTRFNDVAGLDSGSYSSSEDLVKLTKYIIKNYPLIWQILSKNNYKLYQSDGSFHHELINTNELLGQIPDIVGGKTGKTIQAKGCLLLVLNNPQNNDYLIYIILGSDDRFGEMQKLIDWVNKAYKW